MYCRLLNTRTPVHILVVTLWALAATSMAAAQTGTLRGRVLDAESGSLLDRAHVILVDTEFGDATTENGIFRFDDIPAGTYTLAVSSVGYTEWTRSVSVTAGQVTDVDVILSPGVYQIPELVVERESMIGGARGLTSLPGSAHIVSLRTLESFQHTDVNRALRTVPGLNIQEEDGYGLRPNIGIRGTGAERSSKISLMEDGVLAAPAPYAAPSAYYFPSVGRMQEIEIRKGSSQIKYGPFTTGGALNLLSTSIPGELAGSVDGNVGSDENRRLHAWLGNSFEHGGFLAEVFHNQTTGFKNLDFGGDTGFDITDVMLKGRINTDRNADIYQALSLKLVRSREISNETYLGLTTSDFEARPLRRYLGSAEDQMDADYDQAVLRHLVRPASWLQVTTTAYAARFHRNWYKLDKVLSGDDEAAVSISSLLSEPSVYSSEYLVVTGERAGAGGTLNVKANNREYISRGIQSEARLSFDTGLMRHSLEAGFRLHEDEMDRFQWVDGYGVESDGLRLENPGIPGTESNRIESASATALYVQDKIERGRLALHPGFRFEHVQISRKNFGKSDPDRTGAELSVRSNTVDVLIPGLGASFRLNDAYTFFGGVHRGFAPPGSREGTEPESGINYETGVRIRKGTLNADAALFLNDYDNLLGADLASSGGTGSGDQFNGGEALVKGLELSVAQNLGRLIDWKYSLPVQVVYTFTDAQFQHSFESSFDPWGTVEDGDQLPYVPRHRGTVQAGVEGARFDITVQAHYVGEMRTVAGQGSIPVDQKTDAHVVIETSAGYAVNAGVRIFGVVRNLTDEIYVAARRPAGLRPGLPRTAMIGMTVNF